MKKHAIGVLVALSLFPHFSLLCPRRRRTDSRTARRSQKGGGRVSQAAPQALPPVAAPPLQAGRPPGETLQEHGTIEGVRQKPGVTMQGSGGLIYARPFVSSPQSNRRRIHGHGIFQPDESTQ